MKKWSILFLATAMALVLTWGVYAATATATLSVNFSLNAQATLTLSPISIHFVGADADLFPTLSTTEGLVHVTVKITNGSAQTGHLTCTANGPNLVSGTDLIPIEKVSWIGTGAGFVNGTLSDVAAVPVGSGMGPGIYEGNLDFRMVNSWAYASGSYSQTVLFTLSTT